MTDTQPANMGLIAEIEDTVSRFRAGEAEVARTFFSRPRPLEQHVMMLRIQVAREVRNLKEIAEGELSDMVDRVDRDLSRDDIVAELREHYFETRHYAMLGNLLEGISTERLDWKVLADQRESAPWTIWFRNERAVRVKHASTSPLHKAAGQFNSGGAGSVAFGMLGHPGGVYEELVGETAKIVLHDEMAHGGVLDYRNPLYDMIRTKDDADTALSVIREYSTARIHGRNFQFGLPLSEQRVEEIIRGEIDPLDVEELRVAYDGAIDDEVWLDRFRSAPKPLSSSTILR